MASHRHFPKMGGIHFPYWLPGRNPVQLEIIRFKAGFFLLFCCDESDAFLSNCIQSDIIDSNYNLGNHNQIFLQGLSFLHNALKSLQIRLCCNLKIVFISENHGNIQPGHYRRFRRSVDILDSIRKQSDIRRIVHPQPKYFRSLSRINLTSVQQCGDPFPVCAGINRVLHRKHRDHSVMPFCRIQAGCDLFWGKQRPCGVMNKYIVGIIRIFSDCFQSI